MKKVLLYTAVLHVMSILLITAQLQGQSWRYSQVYRAINPTSQFYSALPGLDLLANDDFHPLRGKTVAVVTNHTGRDRQSRHILDLLTAEGIEVKVAFGPEHGLAGRIERGERIDEEVETVGGIRIYSLYGSSRKPTPDQFAGIDVVLFDIQDIGARYYTYASTLTLVMDACARDRIPIFVLDRPSPVRGDFIEGPLVEPDYASFMGLHPVPIRHGLTMGELAVMINEEGWLSEGRRANLTVVPVLNWSRYDWWEDTLLEWRPPSPNIPSPEIARAYLGTCLFEGTNVSEGRGTLTPFLLVGAPWIERKSLAAQLNRWQLPGVSFADTSFTPVSITGMAEKPKYMDQTIGGVRLVITDRDLFRPVHTAAVMIHTIRESYPHKFTWVTPHIDLLWGSDSFRRYIDNGRNIAAHPQTYGAQRDAFYQRRGPYLIYND